MTAAGDGAAPWDAVAGRVRRRFAIEATGHDNPSGLLADLTASEGPLLDAEERALLLRRLRAELLGLGLLEDLLEDPEVTDVLVNGPGPVWVERAGRLEDTGRRLDAEALDLAIERLVVPLGLRADRGSPLVDGRLPDGSRVAVVLRPPAVDGPLLALRRHRTRLVPLETTAGPEVARLLRRFVAERRNLVIHGGTGTGKTTLLNTLARGIDAGERIVTIEDTAELALGHPHVVRLEARPANGEGAGGVGIRELVRAALRLRPDRIIVGEVRGGEALELLWALGSGHDGSISTVHASSGRDALLRLETLASCAGVDVPVNALRVQVRSAVDVLVGVARGADGARRVVSVEEVHQHEDLTTVPLVTGGRVVGTPCRPGRISGGMPGRW